MSSSRAGLPNPVASVGGQILPVDVTLSVSVKATSLVPGSWTLGSADSSRIAVVRWRHENNVSSVLLVDDDVDTRDLLREALHSCGYVVAEASNGLDALTTLDAQPRFDLIVLDLNMPVMNGHEFVEAVRARSEFNAVPIIVMSGEGDAQLVLASGRVRAYLQKPVMIDCFLKAVAQHASCVPPPCSPAG